MSKSLWFRVVVAFVLFLSVGTIGLVFVLDAAFERVSLGQFQALSEANADFIRTMHLPPSDRLAGYLSRMLGAEVQFHRLSSPDNEHEAVTVPIENGVEMTLIRQRPSLRESLMRPVSLGALAAFWALWFALAWAVLRPYLKAQRLAFLGQMATGLAHQIRNPVAAIRLHGQLLQKTEAAAASLIIEEAATIESLVNQWLFLARPEPPRKTDVALPDLIERTVRVLAPAAEHAGIRVVVDAACGRSVLADASRLGQAFQNILLNAIQAMPAGGTATITACDQTITFADTGPGFSAVALRRWAEMLFSEKEGGMGVGLCVAMEIIRAHGGRLSVANHPGGGAVVRIDL